MENQLNTRSWRWHSTLGRRMESRDAEHSTWSSPFETVSTFTHKDWGKPYKIFRNQITWSSCYSIPKKPCETSLHIRPLCLMSFYRTVTPPWQQLHRIVEMLDLGTHPIWIRDEYARLLAGTMKILNYISNIGAWTKNIFFQAYFPLVFKPMCVLRGKKIHLFLIHLCLTHQDITGEELSGVHVTFLPP